MKIILLTGLLIATFSCKNMYAQAISFEMERESVLRDTGGGITGRVHDKPYSIMAWLVNGDGNILFKTTDPFSDSGNQRLRDNIEGISIMGNTTKTRQNEKE
jgi:hypothetical protein